ncbi:rod shape-determining protein MreD [Psychrobacter sp. 16-MNA-CIBAN-0192]|uniref:rod shape-determining protein MreD n=1 Tax=Psychrobacter sp. 16-MNA-CIBAN-0192 TaxID=3140448 RepID=UPI00332F206B
MAHAHSEYSTDSLFSVIFLSFIIASALSVYPLSPSVAELRPILMVMVLIFWLIFQARHVGLKTAFAIGIIIDLLMDSRLGLHAFATVLVVLVINLLSRQLKSLTMATAWLMAAVGLLSYQLCLWLLLPMLQNTAATQSALPLLSSIISWPIVLLLLRRFR